MQVVIFMPVSNSPMDALGMVFKASDWRQAARKERMPKPMERAIKWQGPVEMPSALYLKKSDNE